MKIGYPCINWSLSCRPSRTFRLKSYSESRLVETLGSNLSCLQEILDYNIQNHMLFLRLTSDLVPFASHPVCTFPWQKHFSKEFKALGDTIKAAGMRISMHPDQFTLINSPKMDVFERSRQELLYHSEVLDLMGLNLTARIQIHVGGVYGDKKASLRRFVEREKTLPRSVRRRLAIENDDRLYTLADCLWLHRKTRLPVIFDTLHHQILSSGEPLEEALSLAFSTWSPQKGRPMLDYSDQEAGGRPGKHAYSLNLAAFKRFLKRSRPHDFDVMLEIKDKESSAKKALEAASQQRGVFLD